MFVFFCIFRKILYVKTDTLHQQHCNVSATQGGNSAKQCLSSEPLDIRLLRQFYKKIQPTSKGGVQVNVFGFHWTQTAAKVCFSFFFFSSLFALPHDLMSKKILRIAESLIDRKTVKHDTPRADSILKGDFLRCFLPSSNYSQESHMETILEGAPAEP